MKTGQRGTFADGQKGVIGKVFTNAAVFHSDTGTEFVVLPCEFTPNDATPEEVTRIERTRASLFGHVKPGEGFHFGVKHDGHGRLVEMFVKPLRVQA